MKGKSVSYLKVGEVLIIILTTHHDHESEIAKFENDAEDYGPLALEGKEGALVVALDVIVARRSKQLVVQALKTTDFLMRQHGYREVYNQDESDGRMKEIGQEGRLQAAHRRVQHDCSTLSFTVSQAAVTRA